MTESKESGRRSPSKWGLILNERVCSLWSKVFSLRNCPPPSPHQLDRRQNENGRVTSLKADLLCTLSCACTRGSGDGAGYSSAPGRPTNVDNSRARAYCACSGCGLGLLGYFFLVEKRRMADSMDSVLIILLPVKKEKKSTALRLPELQNQPLPQSSE